MTGAVGLRRAAIAAGGLALVAYPLVRLDDAYGQSVLIFAFLLGVMAGGWNIMAGFTGYVSIGQSAFLGIGAYTVALLSLRTGLSPLLLAPLGGAAAALVGVDFRAVATLTFAIGVATTGVGGSILSVLYTLFPASHYLWISRLLGIVVLGGMGSLPGAVVGSLILGVAEAFTATYVSTRWATVVFYLVILVVLLVRPQGLMGSRLRGDVVT